MVCGVIRDRRPARGSDRSQLAAATELLQRLIRVDNKVDYLYFNMVMGADFYFYFWYSSILFSEHYKLEKDIKVSIFSSSLGDHAD